MVSWFDDDARVSNVVGIAPEDPVFDLPSYAMRMVDPAGRLRSINLVGAVADVPPADRTCGHRVTADGFTRVRLDRADRTAASRWPGSAIYTSAEGFLVVSTAGGVASLPLRQDLNVADVVVDGPIDELELRLEGPADAPADATVCVVDVLVGFPTPG